MKRRSYTFFTLLGFIALSVLPLPSAAQEQTQEERIEFLMKRIGDKSDEPMFEKNVQEFVDIGENAVPPLMEVAKDNSNDYLARMNAIYALGRIGPKAAKAIFTLNHILRSKNSEVDMKVAAASALGRIGRPADPTVETLERYLEHEDSLLSRHAHRALEAIGTRKARRALEEFAQKQAERSKAEAEAAAREAAIAPK